MKIINVSPKRDKLFWLKGTYSRRNTFRCEPYFIPLPYSEDGCRDTVDGNMTKYDETN